MSDLRFALVDADNFDAIPDPAAPGARCQTCDYWERIDGHREPPETGAAAAHDLKRSRLLSGERLAGAYAMLAYDGDDDDGNHQIGPISNYPRAQVIRDRYPELPESPAPWIITCLQVIPARSDRDEAAGQLLEATCTEIDRRGITAVEAYPEGVADGWIPSPGPTAIYERNGFEHAAGDDRYPVYRRELTGEAADTGWGDLLRHARPDDDDDAWPLPLPKGPSEDDLFRLPERPKRPNPFGDD
jgi:hypothetical protein